MNLGAVSSSVVKLLQKRFLEQGGLGGYTFKVFSTSEVVAGIQNHVGLTLYRIDIDPARRHIHLPPAEIGLPSRHLLGLDLHYLLTVWGSASAEGEQEMLGRCMEILDHHAILSGDDLDHTAPYEWEESDALKLCLESLTHEDMLRLWDSMEGSYQLSVPYLVRTVRLSPVERTEGPPVLSRTHVYVPGVPS